MTQNNVENEPSDCEPDPASGSTELLDERPKNAHAVALGRLGGLKGGKISAAKMTPQQRRNRARKAALARWGSKKKKPPKS